MVLYKSGSIIEYIKENPPKMKKVTKTDTSSENSNNKVVKLALVISGIPGYFKLRSKHDDLFRLTAISLRNCLDYIEIKLPGNVELHGLYRSEERRVGKECRSRLSPY